MVEFDESNDQWQGRGEWWQAGGKIMSNSKAAWIVWMMFASWLPRRLCVCLGCECGHVCGHMEKIESGFVWYVFYMITMYVQSYVIW